MSLTDQLANLQSKPRHVRVKIMWLAAVLGSFLIAGLWLLSLNKTLTKTQPDDTKTVVQEINQLKQDLPSLWSSLGAGLRNVTGSLEQSFQDLISESPTPDAPKKLERLPVNY